MSDFDELLDQVLKEDARVEPRLGFEQGILAGLRVEASRKGWRRIWWVPAGVFAGLAVAAALMVQHGRLGSHSAAAKRGVNLGVSQADRASLPTPEKVRKVFELKTLSPDHRSGPPLLPRPRAGGRTASRMGQGEEVGESRLPKMETFPAVAQSAGFFPEPVSSGKGGKLREVLDSPQVTQALLELKAEQEQPLQVREIEIEPL